MSKRVYITMPDGVHQQLQKLAKLQGRATANLAAYLVEKGVENLSKKQDTSEIFS